MKKKEVIKIMFKEWYENLPEYEKEFYQDKVKRVKEATDDWEVLEVIDRYENLPVFYDPSDETIIACNEGGFCITSVDAKTLYKVLKEKFENE